MLVVGGDRAAVTAALEDSRLKTAGERVCGPSLAVPDPRRNVMEAAVADRCTAHTEVVSS